MQTCETSSTEGRLFNITLGDLALRIRSARSAFRENPQSSCYVEVSFAADQRVEAESCRVELGLIDFLFDVLELPVVNARNAVELERVLSRFCQTVIISGHRMKNITAAGFIPSGTPLAIYIFTACIDEQDRPSWVASVFDFNGAGAAHLKKTLNTLLRFEGQSHFSGANTMTQDAITWTLKASTLASMSARNDLAAQEFVDSIQVDLD